MKPQTTAPAAAKRRRTIDEQIQALEAKKARQQITAAVTEGVKTLRREVADKRYADARTSLAILDRAIAELEKGGA